MLRLLTGILMLVIFILPASALNGLAAEQEGNFLAGKLHLCYGAGKVFFEPDEEDLETLKLFSEEDKTVVAFFDILSKYSMGIAYSLPNMPVYKYLVSSLDEDHYMSLTVRALCESSDMKKSLSLCERAMDAVTDAYGEDSWEYAYLLNIKLQRYILLGNVAEAQKTLARYLELNAANGREKWWLNPTIYSYMAAGNIGIKKEDAALACLDSMNKAITDIPQDVVRLVGIVPFMNVVYVYNTAGGWEESLDLSKKIKQWVEDSGLQGTETHAYAKQCVGQAMSMTGSAAEALTLFDEVKNDYKRLGIEDCYYMTTLKNWMKFAKKKK